MFRTCVALLLLALAACDPGGADNVEQGPEVDAGPGLAADGAVAPVAAATYHYQLADDYSTRHGGLALLVLLGDEIVYERYHGGHTADRPLHICSGTKSFWGVAAAAMIQDGLLSSFDERAADTLTEWQGLALKSTITVRHLLSLTSGLAEDIPALQGEDGTAEDKYAYAIGLPLVAQPGKRFRYGPSHYYALGELMKRKLAGQGLDPLAYLEQRILAPIGLEHGPWRHDASGNPHLPNGAHLTARNWMRFGRLLLQQGQ